MKVSWKTSSASCGPTVPTRYPRKSAPCSSSSSWKGGSDSSDIWQLNVAYRCFVRLWRTPMSVDPETRDLVARALAEDLGSGDVTAEAVVPEDAAGRATITQREAGVLFGLDVAAEVFSQTGAGELAERAPEGEWRDEVPARIAAAAGPAR